jgi:hypothetical protein
MSADDFTRRFGSSSSQSSKPDCYGDPRYYERDDPTCRACPSRGTCEVVIKRKDRAGRGGHQVSRSRATTLKSESRSNIPDISKYAEEEAEEGETFTSILVHNSSLNALQGFTATLNDAVAHIPRKGYANIFKAARSKNKK